MPCIHLHGVVFFYPIIGRMYRLNGDAQMRIICRQRWRKRTKTRQETSTRWRRQNWMQGGGNNSPTRTPRRFASQFNYQPIIGRFYLYCKSSIMIFFLHDGRARGYARLDLRTINIPRRTLAREPMYGSVPEVVAPAAYGGKINSVARGGRRQHQQ